MPSPFLPPAWSPQVFRIEVDAPSAKIAVELFELGIIPSNERNYTAPRLTELTDKRLVKVTGKKKCNWTGKMVAVYEKIDTLKLEENMHHIPAI